MMERNVPTRKNFVWCERKKKLKTGKIGYEGPEDFLNCALKLLFFHIVRNEEVLSFKK